ncbi:MAG: hypothetical protein ACI8ZB_004604 [Desulforhopalus sp.]|jgi:hypothetical protein
MNCFIRYSVDVFNSRYIAGWFLNFFQKKKTIRLSFVSGDKKVGELIADRYRKDVELQKVHPTGFCGFDFNFPSNIDVTANKNLDIYIDEQKKPFLKLTTNHLDPALTQPIPRILFMHIPKTAGTSFNAFMRMHVPVDAAAHHIENYTSGKYASLAKDKMYLAGHLPVEILKKNFNISDFDCYSIVRSPYKHLHSHLNWLRGIAALKGSAFFQRHHPAVQRLAIKIAQLDFTDFRQVKDFVFGLQGCELDFFDNIQTRYFLDYRPEKVSLNDFYKTLPNIDLFKHIGLTERYEQFKSFVSSSYELPEVSLPIMTNKTMHPPLYDCDCLDMKEILYPLVHADMRLYDAIKLRFGGRGVETVPGMVASC